MGPVYFINTRSRLVLEPDPPQHHHPTPRPYGEDVLCVRNLLTNFCVPTQGPLLHGLSGLCSPFPTGSLWDAITLKEETNRLPPSFGIRRSMNKTINPQDPVLAGEAPHHWEVKTGNTTPTYPPTPSARLMSPA